MLYVYSTLTCMQMVWMDKKRKIFVNCNKKEKSENRQDISAYTILGDRGKNMVSVKDTDNVDNGKMEKGHKPSQNEVQKGKLQVSFIWGFKGMGIVFFAPCPWLYSKLKKIVQR